MEQLIHIRFGKTVPFLYRRKEFENPTELREEEIDGN